LLFRNSGLIVFQVAKASGRTAGGVKVMAAASAFQGTSVGARRSSGKAAFRTQSRKATVMAQAKVRSSLAQIGEADYTPTLRSRQLLPLRIAAGSV
jgi:hypothetical protein